MLNGYDESNNQGNIDNRLVPGDFDIIKATEGVGYVDPNCDANYQQAKAAGKLPGVYHFARPDGNAAVDEAKWFVSQVQGYLGEAVLVLDFETAPLDPNWAKTFCDTVYELTKVRCWVYANQNTFNTLDWSAVWPNYAAWVASYGMNNQQNGYGAPAAPVSITGNWTIVAWQYTSKGILPGWGGDLDLNVAYLDAAAWHKYAEGDRNAPAPQPAPVAVTPAPPVSPVVQEPAPVSQTPVSDTPVPPAPVTSTPDPVKLPVVTPPVTSTTPVPLTVVETKPAQTPLAVSVDKRPLTLKISLLQRIIEAILRFIRARFS